METGFVYKERMEADQIKVDESEVYRYLGYAPTEYQQQLQGDPRVAQIVTETIQELQHNLSPQSVYCEYPVCVEADDIIDLGFSKTQSHSLALNLKHCDRIILFAATIGPKVDILIQRNSKMDPLKGVIMQAAGAMFIESFCDELNQKLNSMQEQWGLKARPRFSPGYGDLKLDLQKDIFRTLSCSQKIGLTLMDTMIMAPSKSVTAVIGYQKCDPQHLEQSRMGAAGQEAGLAAGLAIGQAAGQEAGQAIGQAEKQVHSHTCDACNLTQCQYRQ